MRVARVLCVLVAALAVVALGAQRAAAASAAATHTSALQQQPTDWILGSQPEPPPTSSLRYKKWLRLVRAGYEGGAAAKQLDAEKGDVDRAAVRLSQAYTGFHGLHCLSKGNCFGMPEHSVFRAPPPTSVPVRPPGFQQPPPPVSAKERARDKQQAARQPKVKGQDFSARMLPRLDPFKQLHPVPVTEEHRRENSKVRQDLGPTEQDDEFQHLMKEWLTTIKSPFYTKKPDSVHESDLEEPPLPDGVYRPIVPVKMAVVPVAHGADLLRAGGMQLRADFHEPPVAQVFTLEQLEAHNEREQKRRKAIAQDNAGVTEYSGIQANYRRDGFKVNLPPLPRVLRRTRDAMRQAQALQATQIAHQRKLDLEELRARRSHRRK